MSVPGGARALSPMMSRWLIEELEDTPFLPTEGHAEDAKDQGPLPF